MLLEHQHVPDAGGGDTDELNASPDARVRQTGAPVPAEHAVGLAQVGEAHHGVGGAVRSGLGIGLFNKAGGGIKFDGNVIFSDLQHGFYVKFIGSVHIFGRSNHRAVDGDGGQGVQPVAAQQHRVALQQVCRNGEIPAVDEVIVHDLQRFVFIVPVERILDLTGGEQVVINRAGDGGADAGESAAGDIQHPGTVEGECFHCNTSEYVFARVNKGVPLLYDVSCELSTDKAETKCLYRLFARTETAIFAQYKQIIHILFVFS